VVDRHSDREGLFWQIARGELPRPPAADTLGWELLAIDPDAGTIEVAFAATDAFLNPAGTVQGGFLAAMLDDTLGPALVATLPDQEFAPTLDLHVQFHRPALPGRLIGHGRIVRRTRDIAFLAGELVDGHGSVLATASATAVVRRLAPRT
jgi:uncharacterized protein (TIGR00369 family)